MRLFIKGLEQIRPSKDIKEWGAGEPHEDKKAMASSDETRKGVPRYLEQTGSLSVHPYSQARGSAAEAGQRASWNRDKNPELHAVDVSSGQRHRARSLSPEITSAPQTGVRVGMPLPKKEKKVMTAVEKADAEKAYPLGEGPKATAGGGQVWAQKIPNEKKPPEKKKIDLGTAPMMSAQKAMEALTPFLSPKSVLVSMIKGCSEKAARLVPDAAVVKGEEDKKEAPKPADKPPGSSFQAKLSQPTKSPVSVPGSGSHLKFSFGKSDPVQKDMEHLAGENKKVMPSSPPAVAAATHKLGWDTPAMFQGGGSRKQALSGAAPQQGATGAMKNNPPGVLSSTSVKPKAKPLAAGSTISMTPVASSRPSPTQKVASMTKSAIEVLKGMINRASSFPGNPARANWRVPGTAFAGNKDNMRGPVSGSEGPANDSQENSPVRGTPSPGRGANENGPVHDTPHGGKGPAQTSVSGTEGPANDSQMSKAVGASAVPRMPRAMAMAMDTWRSATQVLTRGNSAFAEHAGTGPLHAEMVDHIDEATYDRGTRHGPVLKSCSGCGRTYTLIKSTDGCPSCKSLPQSNMAKSRGGYLIPSSISE